MKSRLRVASPNAGVGKYIGAKYFVTAASGNLGPVAAARTRFAPSPTGFMHLGSLRTALYNYLLAKRTGGSFILRIEDTDQKRTIPGAEAQIMDTLRWAGLNWDEGPVSPGKSSPYRQSERAHLYQKHARTLLNLGHAYRCFCTEDRLRNLAIQRGQSGASSDYDRNCATIAVSESVERAAAGEPHVIRLKAPDKYPPYHDEVYGTIRPGKVMFRHGEPSFEDPILVKSDGHATYHLANVVDDHHMEITHVVRGNEWLVSTPKHIHLYSVFNWKPPKFAHVGLLQDDKGRKLSKRDGDLHISSFRERGYTPDGLLNFLALMGWHNPGRSDVLNLQDLVEKFSIHNLSKGDTKVSFEKLDFLQRQHNIFAANSASSLESLEYVSQFVGLVQREIRQQIQGILPGCDAADYIKKALTSDIKNLITIPSFVRDHDYLFSIETTTLPNALLDLQNASEIVGLERMRELREGIIDRLEAICSKEWKHETVRDAIAGMPSSNAEKKAVHKLLRYAIAGGKFGASMSEIIALLGKNVTLQRLKTNGVNSYAKDLGSNEVKVLGYRGAKEVAA